MLLQESEEAATSGRDHPSAPDGPAKATYACSDDRDDDGAGQEEEEDREDVDAALDCRCGADGHEVKR